VELIASCYEYPEDSTGPDADWIEGGIRFEGKTGLELSGLLPISWRADELERFAEQIGEVLHGRSASADLHHLEEQVRMRVTPNSLSVEITDGLNVSLAYRNADIEPMAIRQAHTELGELVASFPSRGRLG
jgi:hypothetical protein